MDLEWPGEGEPLAALADVGELAVPRLLDRSPSRLEGEELVVADAGEPLTRAPTRADLHTTVVAQVVDDLDHRPGEVGVG